YYAKLERGAIAGVSSAVLDSVAQALQLDDTERAHLFDLARAADGIPLHVEELVATGVGDVPETVGEAVLVPRERLSPDAALVLSAAAVIGRRF
ncbi:hypothetical protein SB782_33285, partial [Brevibacillus sp. SIMBA_076]